MFGRETSILGMCFISLCLLALLHLTPSVQAQETQQGSEIPIERCDILPIVKVRIDKTDMRFLLDTAATSLLNLKSFASGRSKEIQISSWSGTAATSAREVSLPELVLGNHRLQNLKLPAIDLSPIGNACGGRIDGILGVDLLDKMGVTIDLKRHIATLASPAEDAKSVYQQMESSMHGCMAAFEGAKVAELEDCFDPDIILYAPQGEFRGRKQVMEYLQNRFLKYAPDLHYSMRLQEAKMYGDALWYSYDYEIVCRNEQIIGHGMSMCRRDKASGRWRVLNLHNSLREPEATAAPETSDPNTRPNQAQ